MTNVIPLASPRAGVPVQLSAQPQTFTPCKPDGIARQQAIENALCMALYQVRKGDTVEAIRTATAKATRAASMLKQACECAAQASPVTATGRA